MKSMKQNGQCRGWMGFGAVLAGGCTVGAGMTGGSLWALTAWLTLISIWLGAIGAFRVSRALGLEPRP